MAVVCRMTFYPGSIYGRSSIDYNSYSPRRGPQRLHLALRVLSEGFELAPQLLEVAEHVQDLRAVHRGLVRHGLLQHLHVPHGARAYLRVAGVDKGLKPCSHLFARREAINSGSQDFNTAEMRLKKVDDCEQVIRPYRAAR
jgi:hypothetical protein